MQLQPIAGQYRGFDIDGFASLMPTTHLAQEPTRIIVVRKQHFARTKNELGTQGIIVIVA